MRIEGTHELRVAREHVYRTLTNPDALQRCIPGCERLEQPTDYIYSATLRVDIGPIKGIFHSAVRLEDIRTPASYHIEFDAQGQPGCLKGSGNLNLEEKDGLTVVKYAGDQPCTNIQVA